MLSTESMRLLQDERVVEEINKHKWFQSEQAGTDIGFEQAAQDWINRYAKEWMRANHFSFSSASQRPTKIKSGKLKRTVRTKKR